MDALTSFTSLADQLPTWITTVKHLSTHASKRHAEFAAEYSRLLSQSRPRKQRSLSVASIRTKDNEQLNRETQPQPIPNNPSARPNATPVSPLEAGNRYLLAQISRKRKPGSSVRSSATQAPKFRCKHMVIVYYDAYLQEQLDTLVKVVGGARNNLRKGKLSRTVQNGLQLPAISRKGGELVAFQSPLKPDKSPTPPIPNSDHSNQPSTTATSFDDGTFCKVDKQLELAQSLCETAAHQVLRDGDCATELNTVREKFLAVLDIAATSVEQLKAEQALTPNEPEPAEPNTSLLPLLGRPASPTTSKLTALALNEKLDLAVSNPASATTEIEVDDESDESIVVDMSKFRAARAHRRQSLTY
jgi:hypothetical protein